MAVKNFQHCDPDAFHGMELTLHDCVADRISYENNTLRFYLSDGFWVTPHHGANAFGKVVRTDAALVAFSIEDLGDISVAVFTRHRWLRKTTVAYWNMEQLIAEVNSGKCTLEFVTQYRTYGEQLWHCSIRSGKKPYYRDCQLQLPNTAATFYWNVLRYDREW